jgi:hypothetical protein
MLHLWRAVGVVVLAVVPVAFALPASAEPAPTLHGLSGHHLVNGASSRARVDGSCGSSSDSGPPLEDRHQLVGADIVKGNDWESLGINICWFNTSANGGDSVDTGTWELYRQNESIRGGSLEGTVAGAVTNAHHHLFVFTLTIAQATGIFSGLTGHFVFWACGDDGSPLIAGGLRTTHHHPFPKACLDTT